MNDILIIGGGIIGLAIALELKLQGTSVTILSRDFKQAATHAAAGMLAPQAEAIPASALLDLCLRSRDLYPDWTAKLEAMTGLPTGYWACGILCPSYEAAGEPGSRGAGEQGSIPDTRHPTPDTRFSPLAYWLDRPAIHQHQPGLGDEVIGGWWYPNDAQVNNRALATALWAAVQAIGVEIREGVAVESLRIEDDRIAGVRTTQGDWQAGHYILATGAWSQQLLPVPIQPKKGQMLSVRVPQGQALPLQQVLFGSETYIVPRQDGQIVIGATSEDAGFASGNTPAGVQALLSRSMRLFPQLSAYPIQEFWWGFRPTTPDEAPILGASPYTNLTLATGHHRNGILLAPITAQVIAKQLLQQHTDPLLGYFHYSRFS